MDGTKGGDYYYVADCFVLHAALVKFHCTFRIVRAMIRTARLIRNGFAIERCRNHLTLGDIEAVIGTGGNRLDATGFRCIRSSRFDTRSLAIAFLKTDSFFSRTRCARVIDVARSCEY